MKTEIFIIGVRFLKKLSIPPQDCYDLMHDVILNLLERKKQVEINSEERYFMSSLRNRTKNFYRKKDYERETFISLSDLMVELIDFDTPEEQLMKKEFIENLLDKVANLPNEMHRDVIEAFLVEDLSYQEIAEEFEISNENVRKIISRFKQLLEV